MKPTLTPVTDIKPGQEFSYMGAQYVRATDEQFDKHPARELLDKRREEYVEGLGLPSPEIVLAYMLTYKNGRQVRTPTSLAVEVPAPNPLPGMGCVPLKVWTKRKETS